MQQPLGKDWTTDGSVVVAVAAAEIAGDSGLVLPAGKGSGAAPGAEGTEASGHPPGCEIDWQTAAAAAAVGTDAFELVPHPQTAREILPDCWHSSSWALEERWHRVAASRRHPHHCCWPRRPDLGRVWLQPSLRTWLLLAGGTGKRCRWASTSGALPSGAGAGSDRWCWSSGTAGCSVRLAGSADAAAAAAENLARAFRRRMSS